ncbi:unnamed protein product [Kuraishia capsulata CBS 1993]|uniref:Uncharacterized protein n=1 Tax=Kuraishia capsulata CBS 1993 TaxID=1382522 RepID=W6MHU9_9ASCO|nr:uncharacterized protein KUCA_T00001571001 [Kuraishia capsulata CBS 1993]CDK25601.1 unnamed protein product [Kuraishia capsulata CBS 1993]
MEAAMSTTAGRGMPNSNGAPRISRAQAFENSAFIDVTKEVPIRPQPNQYYSPQIQQNGFYQQQNMSYDGSYGNQPHPYMNGNPSPQHMNSPRQSMNAMHSRRSSITSTTSSSMNRFFHGKLGKSSGGGGGDDEDEGETEAQPGVDVSFDDIQHLRDRGRYGMSNATFDTTPYIPTLSSKPKGPNGQMDNTQYRKQKTMQKKLALKGSTATAGPRANSLQSGPAYMGPGMNDRAMSLNSRPPMGFQQDPRTMSMGGTPPQWQQWQPQQQPYYGNGQAPMVQSPRMGMQPIPQARTMSFNGQQSPVMRGGPIPPQQLHQRGSWSNLQQQNMRGPMPPQVQRPSSPMNQYGRVHPQQQQHNQMIPIASPDPHNQQSPNSRHQIERKQQKQYSPDNSNPPMGSQSRTSMKSESSKEVSPLRSVYTHTQPEGIPDTKQKKKLNKYSFHMEEDIDEEIEKMEQAKGKEIEEHPAGQDQEIAAEVVTDAAARRAIKDNLDATTEAPVEAPVDIAVDARAHTSSSLKSSREVSETSVYSSPSKSLRDVESLKKISPQRSYGNRDSIVSAFTDVESPLRVAKQPLYQLSTGTANEVYVTAPEFLEQKEHGEENHMGLGVVSTETSAVAEKAPSIYSVTASGPLQSQRSLDSTQTLGNQDSAISDSTRGSHGSHSLPSANDTTVEDFSSANNSTMMEDAKSHTAIQGLEDNYVDDSSVIYKPERDVEGYEESADTTTPASESTLQFEKEEIPPPPTTNTYRSMLLSDQPPPPLQMQGRKPSFPPPTSAVMANRTEKLSTPNRFVPNFSQSSTSVSSQDYESPKIPQVVNRKNSAISLKGNSPILKSVNFFKKVSKKAKEMGSKEDMPSSGLRAEDFSSSSNFNVIGTEASGLDGSYSHSYNNYAQQPQQEQRTIVLPSGSIKSSEKDLPSVPSVLSPSVNDRHLPTVPSSETPSDNNEFDFGSPKKTIAHSASRTRRPRRSVDTKSVDIMNYKLEVDFAGEDASLFSRNSSLIPSDVNISAQNSYHKKLPSVVEDDSAANQQKQVTQPQRQIPVQKPVHTVSEPKEVAQDLSEPSPTIISSQTQSRGISADTPLNGLSVEQLGMLHSNMALMEELQAVSNALAESITRELNLDQKLKAVSAGGATIDEDSSKSEGALREKSLQISDLAKQLVEERKKRYIAEEFCLKWENGIKPSPLELSYQNSELTTKALEQEEKLAQAQQKVESLEAEYPELLDKVEKLTAENRELSTVTLPHLKNTVQVLESQGVTGESSDLAKENEFLKSQLDAHLRESGNVTMIEQQRDGLRDAMKSMKEQHEIELRLANEKVKNLEGRLAKLSSLNSNLSRRVGSGAEAGSPNLRIHTSFQNLRTTSTSSSSEKTQSTGLTVPLPVTFSS